MHYPNLRSGPHSFISAAGAFPNAVTFPIVPPRGGAVQCGAAAGRGGAGRSNPVCCPTLPAPPLSGGPQVRRRSPDRLTVKCSPWDSGGRRLRRRAGGRHFCSSPPRHASPRLAVCPLRRARKSQALPPRLFARFQNPDTLSPSSRALRQGPARPRPARTASPCLTAPRPGPRNAPRAPRAPRLLGGVVETTRSSRGLRQGCVEGD